MCAITETGKYNRNNILSHYFKILFDAFKLNGNYKYNYYSNYFDANVTSAKELYCSTGMSNEFIIYSMLALFNQFNMCVGGILIFILR